MQSLEHEDSIRRPLFVVRWVNHAYVTRVWHNAFHVRKVRILFPRLENDLRFSCTRVVGPSLLALNIYGVTRRHGFQCDHRELYTQVSLHGTISEDARPDIHRRRSQRCADSRLGFAGVCIYALVHACSLPTLLRGRRTCLRCLRRKAHRWVWYPGEYTSGS